MHNHTRDQTRFWGNVTKTDTCWLWQKPGTDGYGRFFMQGEFHQAHHVSYGWEYEPVPVHLVVDHLCRVHACVRPSHLEVVTQAENVRRAVRKPRSRVPSVDPTTDMPKHRTGSQPRYCRACLRPANECTNIVKRVCEDCRRDHTVKAMDAINTLMHG